MKHEIRRKEEAGGHTRECTCGDWVRWHTSRAEVDRMAREHAKKGTAT